MDLNYYVSHRICTDEMLAPHVEPPPPVIPPTPEPEPVVLPDPVPAKNETIAKPVEDATEGGLARVLWFVLGALLLVGIAGALVCWYRRPKAEDAPVQANGPP